MTKSVTRPSKDVTYKLVAFVSCAIFSTSLPAASSVKKYVPGDSFNYIVYTTNNIQITINESMWIIS